jgi:LysM repeat protein
MRPRNGTHTAGKCTWRTDPLTQPRLIAPIAALAVTLVAGPILSTALAADPTVVVRPGDTLTSLSKRHGVRIAMLVDLNGLADANRIFAGQRLRIAGERSAPRAPKAATAQAAARQHIVTRGQNLTVIARRYGVSVAAIVSANRISNPGRIYAGQRLKIPGSSAAAAPAAVARAPAARPAAARQHIVTRGQNLTVIARRYGVSVAAIVSANRISNPGRIYAGQRLKIPAAGAAAARQAPAAAARAVPASMAGLVARRDAVRRVIVEEARRYKVPAAFALAVAWQESGWQQGVVSHAGAVGVMQLMPATADWVGAAMLGTAPHIRDTRWNVRAGVRLLAHYLNRYDGDRDRVLAAYYQGQSATDRHGIYPVSRPYIASIKVLVRMFGG